MDNILNLNAIIWLISKATLFSTDNEYGYSDYNFSGCISRNMVCQLRESMNYRKDSTYSYSGEIDGKYYTFTAKFGGSKVTESRVNFFYSVENIPA